MKRERKKLFLNNALGHRNVFGTFVARCKGLEMRSLLCRLYCWSCEGIGLEAEGGGAGAGAEGAGAGEAEAGEHAAAAG